MVRDAQGVVGELIWLSCRSRIDISFAVVQASTWMTRDPGYSILLAKHILRYLRGTVDYGLRAEPFSEDDYKVGDVADEVLEAYDRRGEEAPQAQTQDPDIVLRMYADASFAPSGQGSKSFHCAVVMLGSCPISWRATKQSLTAESSSEAELGGQSLGSHLLLGAKYLVDECGFSSQGVGHCDNRATLLMIASSASSSWRSRHFQVRAASLRERITLGVMNESYIPGVEQVADIGTKALTSQKHEIAVAMVNLDPTKKRHKLYIYKAVKVADGEMWVPERYEDDDSEESIQVQLAAMIIDEDWFQKMVECEFCLQQVPEAAAKSCRTCGFYPICRDCIDYDVCRVCIKEAEEDEAADHLELRMFEVDGRVVTAIASLATQYLEGQQRQQELMWQQQQQESLCEERDCRWTAAAAATAGAVGALAAVRLTAILKAWFSCCRRGKSSNNSAVRTVGCQSQCTYIRAQDGAGHAHGKFQFLGSVGVNQHFEVHSQHATAEAAAESQLMQLQG